MERVIVWAVQRYLGKIMKKLLFGISFLVCGFASVSFQTEEKSKSIPFEIKWVNNLKGDYSFINKWNYHLNVFKDTTGEEFRCDWYCPEEIERMKDSTGRIIKDSLTAFFKILDTTHLHHTIECDAWCYQYAGTDFMEVYRLSNDSVFCGSACTPGTHCSLQLDIVKDICFAKIDLNSIVMGGDEIFYCTDGYIKIDKKLWAKGIMKAEFDFNFYNSSEPKQQMYWKGKIYSEIKKWED